MADRSPVHTAGTESYPSPLSSLAGLCRRLPPLPQRVERFGCVDIDKDGVIVHLDLGDELGVLADQVLGPDIAGERDHLGKEPARAEDRAAAVTPPRRDDA